MDNKVLINAKLDILQKYMLAIEADEVYLCFPYIHQIYCDYIQNNVEPVSTCDRFEPIPELIKMYDI